MRFLVLLMCVAAAAAALPDTTHNVGVEYIAVPRGEIDSGQAIAPQVAVRNYTASPESLWVFMNISAGYRDSFYIVYLVPSSVESIWFRTWVPCGRDSSLAVAWTKCRTDSFPDDDTARSRFLIRVKDVAVTAILAPLDTLDSGLVVHPRASVWNYGNQTQTFPLEFRIGSWVSRATVVNLIPGGQQEITAPDPYYTVPGMYLHQVTAIVPGDLHSENNVLRDTFWARGTVTCDLEIVISAPCGAYDTLDTIIPHATICGFVLHPETCGVWFTIENPDDSVVYRESLTVVVVHLPLDVEFPPTVLRDIGRHLAACSLYCVHNQNHLNNVMREYFYIFARLRGDMGIVWVSLPRDTIDTLATQSMAVGVRNFASECDSGALFLMFRDVTRDSLVYSADTAFGLAGGAAITVMFPLHRFQTLGPHDGLCSLWAYNADTSNALRWRFWVVPRLGVTEGSVPASSRPPPATLIRGVLFLGAGRRGQSTTGQSLVFLLDAAGREVMALKPGPNDVRHLPAGVYFICRAEIPGDSPQRDIPRISVGVAMAKVVIQH